MKKTWLKNEFENGYVFRRLDERAKVFIEYGPAEKAWVPVNAPNYLMINCFGFQENIKDAGMAKHYCSLLSRMPKHRVGMAW